MSESSPTIAERRALTPSGDPSPTPGKGRGGHARRIFNHAIVFLLLGAIVNIAVAWASAASVDLDQWPRNPKIHYVTFESFQPENERAPYWEYTVHRRTYPGAMRITFFFISDASAPDAITVRLKDFFPSWGRAFLYGRDLNHHPIPDDVPIRAEVEDVLRVADARGWPCLALWGGARYFWLDQSNPQYVKFQSAIPLRDFDPTSKGHSNTGRFLPLRPIWPGFAINTIFYAAIMWLLFAVPGKLRRRRRIKRALCPACAYPVGTTPVCTECGAAVTAQPQRGDGM